MGTVYRKSATKSLPASAEVFVRQGNRFARWKDAKGKTRTAVVTTGVDGADRIVVEARTFTAKYRDGAGVVREVATGCRDETAARSVLADLERRAELVKAGVITSGEDAVAAHQAAPLSVHIDAFLERRTKRSPSGLSLRCLGNARQRLDRIATECNFKYLCDLRRESFDKWMKRSLEAGMTPSTCNEYRKEIVVFGNWCVQSSRLLSNPFAAVPKANVATKEARKRRSLTEAELIRLLDVARRRPLIEATTIRRGKRKGQTTANVRDDVRDELERLGRERALIYKTLVLTGLRKGELASLTIGQLELDGRIPFVVLHAADEKNRQGSHVPLRSDLADDLRQWIADKAAAWKAAKQANGGADDSQGEGVLKFVSRDEAKRQGHSCQQASGATQLPASTQLFTVPAGLVRILDRDLKLAGIPKRDERGRTVDVHALRHCFGTLLSKAGVAPRTAQAAMRHSTIDLTMNTYTDPKLLDVAGALELLPALPVSGGPQSERNVAKATGTDDYRAAPFAPGFAPTADNSRQTQADIGKPTLTAHVERDDRKNVVSLDVDKEKRSLTNPVNERQKVETRGVEPLTPALQRRCSPN